MSHVAVVENGRTDTRALLRASSPVPHLSRWAWTADAVTAAVLAAATVTAALQHGSSPGFGIVRAEPTPLPTPAPLLFPIDGHSAAIHGWQLILGALAALPLVVRRRFPLAAFWAVVGATLLFHLGVRNADTAAFTFLACLIAAYSAAMYSPYRAAAAASLVMGAALIAGYHDANVPNIKAGYAPFLVLLPIGLAANTVHTWKQRVRDVESKQQAATLLAVEHERARIARELHDVVTHNVIVMVVQAGAARKVLDAEPEQAREALLAVEAGGRAALAELRHVMGLLMMTADDDLAGAIDLAPQPGLDQVSALAMRIRDAGVPVEVTVTGIPTTLPAGVDLAAYRVVQEALTNTVKHAAGARVHVSVDYARDAVRVEITDTGGGFATSNPSGSGRGLIGMRERLAVYGGTLQAGARPTGGYRVSAVIPVEQP